MHPNRPASYALVTNLQSKHLKKIQSTLFYCVTVSGSTGFLTRRSGPELDSGQLVPEVNILTCYIGTICSSSDMYLLVPPCIGPTYILFYDRIGMQQTAALLPPLTRLPEMARSCFITFLDFKSEGTSWVRDALK